VERRDIDAGLERVRSDFHDLLDAATVVELRAPTNGTKWTNEQLLFHMLFGFLLVRTLLVLVKAFARLPDAVSRTFAAALNAGTGPLAVTTSRMTPGDTARSSLTATPPRLPSPRAGAATATRQVSVLGSRMQRSIRLPDSVGPVARTCGRTPSTRLVTPSD
jgi:hypothetical protein